ncbi:V-set and immunoglobulin domain-containing protein 1 isoform X2 [Oryzias melastigma]|uniref:V-set and immunoglobulin domain-containing protein 1 isoform X2 n=1 Tax=Oryzias melastigma TaxID=30732 RepID=UPI00168D51C0|nr:V-set and immunoglobulin domain-containing protein 1 isoform X2 [Oryzias melastigma]
MKMSSTPFLVGILFLALFVTDVYSVLNSLKGSSIVLSPDVEEPSIISVTWKHGADLAAEWFGGSVTFYRSFKDRCSLDTKSGELTINNVKLEDGGVYTPEINNNVRAAVTLRVLSPVPKPNITHDCKPEQTKCTLTCTFHKTDDMGEVQIIWIHENRVEKGDGALEITEETKEKTFICSLENSVSSENSTELQNPLLTDGKSGRTHIAVVLSLLVLAVCAVFLFLLYKKHPIIMRFFNKREETSTNEEQENLTEDLWPNGTEGILKTESVTTKTSTAAGGDVDQSDESSDSIKKETNPFLSEIEKCNAESSVTVTAEINSQNDPNTTNTQEPDQNPDPVLSIESKPDPETNTTNRPEPDESPDPAPSSETRPDPEETRPNQESRVTVTAEINHQNESNPQEPDLEPATTPSIETTHEPNSKTDEDAENLNKDPSEEVLDQLRMILQRQSELKPPLVLLMEASPPLSLPNNCYL